jgi:hypothetical protein
MAKYQCGVMAANENDININGVALAWRLMAAAAKKAK